jgi:hypothetical protein
MECGFLLFSRDYYHYAPSSLKTNVKVPVIERNSLTKKRDQMLTEESMLEYFLFRYFVPYCVLKSIFSKSFSAVEDVYRSRSCFVV